jgi:hypothetical protein
MKYSFVQIRFIRDDDTSGKTDCIIDVKRNDDIYIWMLRDEDHSKAMAMRLDYDGVIKRLRAVLRSVVIDDDPFKSVQIIAPGYPSVLYKIQTLRENLSSVIELLDLIFENWAENTTPRTVYRADTDDANPEAEAAQEEAEAEEEESDDDMPPLVSGNAVFNEVFQDSSYQTPTRNSQRTCCPNAPLRHCQRFEERSLPSVQRRIINTPLGDRIHTRWN